MCFGDRGVKVEFKPTCTIRIITVENRKNQPCDNCGFPVGRHFLEFGEGLLCQSCAQYLGLDHQIGGEG
jgi:hypothetical protein